MHTHLEFTADATLLDDAASDTADPGLRGEKLARFLAAHLPQEGFAVTRVHDEDWGWRVVVENADFGLWIGCGQGDETENSLLCFIEPSKPVIRKWLRKIDTRPTVERLADALQRILTGSGHARELRWWSADDVKMSGGG